ncbi:hypothetical protein GIB67_020473 [Kingdonia uniflora]|uniref:Uncharacterized protein n=1 Tax=Kingdonia uniflora TaxID=39325 RepID=A0A7J7LUX7_9MAGN|nr:hypothetical protein GIB67_020473 [Kingdonia uniflora]
MQYWFYEYYGVGHPIVKEEVKFLSYPYLKAWERRNKKKTNDQAANLFIQGKYHIDHRTIEMINWQPWLDSAVSGLDDVRTALLHSRKRMPLQILYENCEYYLGDRCWRQLAGTAGILLDLPLNMSSHLSPADLQAIRQASIVDCDQFVIGEEREIYVSYWVGQTDEVDHLLTDSQRMGNVDLFGPTTLRAGITPVVVTSLEVYSFSQDFSLYGEPEGPDPGWHME